MSTELRALLPCLVGAAVSDAAASSTLQPRTHLPCCQEKPPSYSLPIPFLFPFLFPSLFTPYFPPFPSYFGTTCGTEETPPAQWEKGTFQPEQLSSATHPAVTQTIPVSTREGEPQVLDRLMSPQDRQERTAGICLTALLFPEPSTTEEPALKGF